MQGKISIYIFIVALSSAFTRSFAQKSIPTAKGEVIYHIFQRSFYDSNNDLNGDLNGIREKLDYLQDLGVTSILLTPLYVSESYHNYFASDFKNIDPEYGTTKDLFDLVKEVHRRGMKIYLDMETQYVTEDHPWYKESYGHPSSSYSKYIVYNDTANRKPETIIYDLTELAGYNGVKKKVTTVNLYSPEVLNYNFELFKYWMDPNNDGKFIDGVDGFRLDHMMDDLDWKKKFTDLFAKFWVPLIQRLKAVNPGVIFIAEQANWFSFGIDYFTKAGVDRVFAFRLQQAIASFDKKKIMTMADSTFSLTPSGKEQVVFIENHDMPRFSSAVKGDPGKLRVGAALNLLIGGIPSIYYGQELGMEGTGGPGKFGSTDGNDIPMRESFEWYKSDAGPGMALWYKDSGPWWDSTNLKSNDGISLEEEKNDPNSLWNFYRKLILLKQANPALSKGKYESLKNDNYHVLSFLRYENETNVVVIVNLSGSNQNSSIDLFDSRINLSRKKPVPLLEGVATINESGFSVTLSPYAVQVWSIK